jgi:hypothetical protein
VNLIEEERDVIRLNTINARATVVLIITGFDMDDPRKCTTYDRGDRTAYQRHPP